MTFDEFAAFVDSYDGPMVLAIQACRRRLEALAELYADPSIKVTSFWTIGFGSTRAACGRTRWSTTCAPLTGKISEPGNSPFSLTGQPSACGTAREVGTFSYRLPADMLVTRA